MTRDFYSSAFGASPDWVSDIIVSDEVEEVSAVATVNTPTQPASSDTTIVTGSVDLSNMGPPPQDPYMLSQWLGELVKTIGEDR